MIRARISDQLAAHSRGIPCIEASFLWGDVLLFVAGIGIDL